VTLTTRGSLALVLSFVAFVAIALPLDRSSTAAQQFTLSLLAWAFLAITLVLQPRAIRVQVIALVVLATILECVGSLIWGAYTYRLENLPLYVPAGHGLFYLSALRAASLPLLQRHARAVVIGVTTGATVWMLYGLVARPLPDLLGFVTWAIFIRFIVRGRYPLLYAVSFAMTTALELYGTGLGIWTWSPVLPVLMLPAGNPPTGIGAGYAAMDALTRRIVARIKPAAVAEPQRQAAPLEVPFVTAARGEPDHLRP
jgi:type IV secretory pathway VirB3-like protein